MDEKELARANELQAEIFHGISRGEPAERLLLKAIESKALRDGDTVSYKEARENMKAIYGIGLGEEVPLQIELEEVEGRLTKLRESYEREKDSDQKDMVERLKNAIRAHEERVESLRARLAK
mgnify:FL=1